jgi:hypothetical protein
MSPPLPCPKGRYRLERLGKRLFLSTVAGLSILGPIWIISRCSLIGTEEK